MAVYSFCGTPIQIEISDPNARIFNNVAQNVSVDNQEKHIRFNGSKTDIDIFNKISTIINIMLELSDETGILNTEELWPLRLIKVAS